MRQVKHDKEKKRFSAFILFSLFIYFLWIIFSGGLRVNLFFIILDLSLFLFTLLTFLFFFSQFIFPLINHKDRFSAFKRLLSYITRQHGLVSIVKDGSIGYINHNLKRNKPGLIWLDSASAAILCNESGLNRVVGPGIVFTEKSEYAVSSADLHIQTQWLGPLLNENPFGLKRKIESPETYQEKSIRADQTRAITKDGIEIIPSFSFSFKLISSFGDGKSVFGYNPLSVERALIGQPIEPGKNEPESMVLNWHELPGLLIANIWRETLEKFSFNEMFQEKNNALKMILEHMQLRLTRNELNEIGVNAFVTGNKKTSNEFYLLQNKGICFLNLHLQQFWFSPEIESPFTRRIILGDFQKEYNMGNPIHSFMEKEGFSVEEEKLTQAILQAISNFNGFEKISPQKLKEQIMLHYLK